MANWTGGVLCSVKYFNKSWSTFEVNNNKYPETTSINCHCSGVFIVDKVLGDSKLSLHFILSVQRQ